MDNLLFGADYETVFSGWKAKQNDKGVIYYANDTLQITSWNHPYLDKVVEDLESKYGDVKYAAYRTALKIRHLQLQTGISRMSSTAIKHVFDTCSGEDGCDSPLSYSEALTMIQSIMERSDIRNQHEADMTAATELILNFMVNLFDIDRSGKLPVKSLRNALTALCSAKLNEKYRCFFLSVRDNSQKIAREQLLYFIDDLMQITDLFKESEAFGRNVAAAVDSCFKLAGTSQGQSISEENFYSWLMQEPQTLVWLPTLHRIIATETVHHDVSCSVCRTTPIVGLRYRCLQCFKYDQCQDCFLRGQSSLTHKLKHPIKEYCFPTSIKDNTKAMWSIMLNKLSRSHRRQAKMMYLPVDSSVEQEPLADWQPRSLHACPAACRSQSTDSGLAGGSDNGETVIDIPENQLEGQEFDVTCQFRPETVLGKPCDSSSPVVEGADMDIALLSKQDMEAQQRKMTQTIEHLQRENRQLQRQLRTFQEICDVEFSNHSDDEEQNVGLGMLLAGGDPIEEITATSFISPITASMRAAGNDLSAEDGQHTTDSISGKTNDALTDTLAIVGTCTPVRSTPLTGLTTDCPDTEKKTSAPQNISLSCNITESVNPSGLLYRSSDMSLHLDGSLIDSDHVDAKTNLQKTDVSESVSPSGLVGQYRSSDMSVDFQSTHEIPAMSEASVLGKYESIQNSQSSISDTHLKLVNYSIKSSSLSDRKKFSDSDVETPLSSMNQDRQPCLVFTSSSLRSKPSGSAHENTSSHPRPDAVEVDDWCQSVAGKNDAADAKEDHSCMELSEILPHTKNCSWSSRVSPFLHSRESTPVELKTTARRKTVEPVHMSTPVTKSEDFQTVPKSAFVKRPQSAGSSKFLSKVTDKENRPAGVDQKKSSSKQFSPSEFGSGTTPLSSIPPWQRKRILMSINSVPSNNTTSMDTLTPGKDSTDGLSMLFKKADHIGRLMNEGVSQTMATWERDELEQMMVDFEKECKLADDEPDDREAGSSRNSSDDDSMLEAVLSIGNAMSDFVQATAQYPR